MTISMSAGTRVRFDVVVEAFDLAERARKKMNDAQRADYAAGSDRIYNERLNNARHALELATCILRDEI